MRVGIIGNILVLEEGSVIVQQRNMNIYCFDRGFRSGASCSRYVSFSQPLRPPVQYIAVEKNVVAIIRASY
jgi:hypothetical protein